MKYKNEDKWNNCVEINKDPYGKATIDYARSWANLMEEKMAALEVDVADNAALFRFMDGHAGDLSHKADGIDDLTGLMYGAAVSTLTACWLYGELLRLWHNLNTQIKDEGEKANEEGGVLNPAIITINTKD